ncbi:MAG: phosphatidate cytidylyltransferase, partial [Rickettsiales bacterium]|nr:phosphatidate cytidylyltransferase [Rickettsiales bacterium]
MTNATKRILTSFAMAIAIAAVAYFGLVRWLTVAVAAAMCAEIIKNKIQSKIKWKIGTHLLFALCSLLFISSAWFVGAKPWIMLLLIMIIAAADIGAWFFGRYIDGDKLWPRLSPNKTWAGQIAGIICGTFASVMYGLLGTDAFLSSLMWIGIGVSLLSQYGDLALSAIKRKFGIKDFGNYLPGHGGFADRFDGWILVLPI